MPDFQIAFAKNLIPQLDSDRFLLTGGRVGHTANMKTYIYQISTHTWSTAGDLNAARSFSACGWIEKGSTAVIATGSYRTSLEVFDAQTLTWTLRELNSNSSAAIERTIKSLIKRGKLIE